MNAGSIAGIAIGTIIATRSPGDLIKVLVRPVPPFLITEAVMLRSRPESSNERHSRVKRSVAEPERINSARLCLGRFFHGNPRGMLGLGGGTVAVPVQNVLFKIPLKNAIANSLATIVVSASIGAVLYFLLGSGHLFSASDALIVAAAIVPGSITGAYLATKIAHRVPDERH